MDQSVCDYIRGLLIKRLTSICW